MALALAKAVVPPVIVMSVWRAITVIVATSTSPAIDSTGSSATATNGVSASNPHPASHRIINTDMDNNRQIVCISTTLTS